MALNFNFQVPIKEQQTNSSEDFFIEGVAINSTTTSNKHTFLSEELAPSAKTLTGVPLLKDHKNSVDSIVGRVSNSKYDDNNNNIVFKAKVMDKTMREMISDGRLNSVSIGADVDNIEESDDGNLIPRGITFRELSLVAIGADQGANFGIAMKEAYKKNEEVKMTNKKIEKKVEAKKEVSSANDSVKVEEKTEKKVEEKVAEEKKVEENKVDDIAKLKEENEKLQIELLKKENLKLQNKIKESEEENKAEEKSNKESFTEENSQVTEEKGAYSIQEGVGTLFGGAYTVMR